MAFPEKSFYSKLYCLTVAKFKYQKIREQRLIFLMKFSNTERSFLPCTKFLCSDITSEYSQSQKNLQNV